MMWGRRRHEHLEAQPPPDADALREARTLLTDEGVLDDMGWTAAGAVEVVLAALEAREREIGELRAHAVSDLIERDALAAKVEVLQRALSSHDPMPIVPEWVAEKANLIREREQERERADSLKRMFDENPSALWARLRDAEALLARRPHLEPCRESPDTAWLCDAHVDPDENDTRWCADRGGACAKVEGK